MWMAPDRQRAALAFDVFIATYAGKSPKAAACIAQDREVLLVLYGFPAEPLTGHYRRHSGAGLQAGKETSGIP
jgi:hypothetical protein